MTLTSDTAGVCAVLLLFAVVITTGGLAARDRTAQERRSADLEIAQNWLADWRAGATQAPPEGWSADLEPGPTGVEVVRLHRSLVSLRSLRSTIDSKAAPTGGKDQP